MWCRGAALGLGLLLLAASVPAQVAVPGSSGAVVVSTPALLEVWNRPIIELRAGFDQVTPADRVSRAQVRIEALPLSAWRDAIRATPTTMGAISGLFVTVGGQYVFAVLPEDLDPESSQTLASAGDSAVSRLAAALRARADQRRTSVILRGVALTALATVLLVVLLRLVGKLRRAALARPVTTKISDRAHFLGLNLGPVLTSIERAISKVTALSAVVVILYLWLTFVFAQFPFTQPWGRELGGYLRRLLMSFGAGILGAIPGLFAVLLIFLLTRIAARGINAFFQGVESGQLEINWLEPETARATRRVVIVLVWVFAVIVAYPYIPGSETPVFKGVSVFVGLMATLGSAGVVNHLVSGMVIVYSRACKPGDHIRVGEIEGVVTQVGVLSTKIATRKREEITIPNAVLVGTSITNFSRLAREHGSIISTTVTIGYDAPWRQVHELLLRAAASTQGIRADPPAHVEQRALSDFYVEYELRMHIDRSTDRVPILSALHASIQDEFNAAGVQIMSPHFEEQPEGKVWVPKTAWHGRSPEAG